MRFLYSFAPLVVAGIVAAHGSTDEVSELLERREFLASQKRTGLSHCASSFKARGLDAKNVERRAAAVDAARAKSTSTSLYYACGNIYCEGTDTVLDDRRLEETYDGVGSGYQPQQDLGGLQHGHGGLGSLCGL